MIDGVTDNNVIKSCSPSFYSGAGGVWCRQGQPVSKMRAGRAVIV